MDKVLVVIGYTIYKQYCRSLFPKIYDDLTYKNKECLFVDNTKIKNLHKMDSGDVICAFVRDYGISQALMKNYDWVFQLDIDAVPDRNIIEKLLAVNHPFVAGTLCARGNARLIIGHDYTDRKTLERKNLQFALEQGVKEVDGATGGLMLIHRSIFSKVGYSGYTGVNVIPNRTTCDDEFYCLKVFEKTKIRPKINLDVGAWHLDFDHFAYRYYDKRKIWSASHNQIIFNKKIYE